MMKFRNVDKQFNLKQKLKRKIFLFQKYINKLKRHVCTISWYIFHADSKYGKEFEYI